MWALYNKRDLVVVIQLGIPKWEVIPGNPGGP